MPDSAHALLHSLLSRLLAMWVKPTVLPADPAVLINPNVPILYVLEVGGAADRIALQLVCKQHNLPDPQQPLSFSTARERTSVVVLQRRQGLIFRRHRHTISTRLIRLVEAGMSSNSGELQIVPVAVYWGRAPERESSIWRLWFTENWQFAGRTRKLLTTLIHGRHTLLYLSEPLSFETLKSSGERASTLQRKLSRVLRVHFRHQRMATLGPDQSHRRMLVDHVLSDPNVRQAIAVEAAESKSERRANQRAERYAFEIAADVSYPTVRILQRLLTRLWNELYDGVELSGIERVKRVADGNELVYVPCHRSHIDYLLLSYILYMQGFSLPHIAAGINLNLPVVGGLLRRGGAFFLRRRFTGKPLYAAVFGAYLKEILQRGHALEYFVEGGRSRTGRLLPPKGGMLAMTVQAYLQQARTPVVFIPVYFGYERLIEGRAFTSELAGGKKQRESIFALLKSLRTLKENYGSVYVNFGTPIALDDLLDKHQPDWRDSPVSQTRPQWITPVVDELGASIMRNINEAASVTPISLLATTLLATPQGCISQDELVQQINTYQQLLRHTYANTTVVVPTVDALQLIDHGTHLGFIESQSDDIGQLIQLRKGQAAPLTYFRNNILHLLTLPALVATALVNRRQRTEAQLQHLVSLTYPILQGELLVKTVLNPNALTQTLEALSSVELIHLNEGSWQRAPTGSAQALSLIRLAEVVTPALERGYLCAATLARALTPGVSAEELSRRCQLSAQRLSRTHGRDSAELFDKHLHNTFVDSLIARGYISQSNSTLSPTDALLDIEGEAHSLLGEQARHALINTTIATVAAIESRPS